MNRRGVLGQALTSPISMIIVFLVMLVFVIISGVIAKNHELNEDMPKDFLNSYIAFNNEVVQINSLIGRFCDDKSFGEKLKTVLREQFIDEYGRGDIFILSYVKKENSIKIISWAGIIDNYIDSNGDISDYDSFNKLVNYKDDKSTLRICNGVDIYLKRGDS